MMMMMMGTTTTKTRTAADMLLSRRQKRRDEGDFGRHEPRIFRRLYNSCELPMRVVFSGRTRRVGWLTDDILSLDLQYYLPIFVGAFREPDEPFGFLALEASLDVVALAGSAGRLLTLGPLVIGNLKLALRSKAEAAVRRGLLFLGAFLQFGGDLARHALEMSAVESAVDAAKLRHPPLRKLASDVLLIQ